jgi:hypothetical protein
MKYFLKIETFEQLSKIIKIRQAVDYAGKHKTFYIKLKLKIKIETAQS